MLFFWGLLGVGTIANDISLNMTKQFSSSDLVIQQQKHEAANKTFTSGIAGVVFALFMFIALIPITFVIRNTKAVGIILIIFGLIIFWLLRAC